MAEKFDLAKWTADTEKEVEGAIKELQDAFMEIQQPRTDFELEHYVVGQHDTPAKQYAQCVLEMQIKYDNIRRAQLNKDKVNLEKKKTIKKMEACEDEIDRQLLEIEIKTREIDMEEQDRAMLGALREFKALYTIYKAFNKKYTREELNNDQPEYWRRRLLRQANQDIAASGRIGVGNLDALKQYEYSPVLAQKTPSLNGVVPIPPMLPSFAGAPAIPLVVPQAIPQTPPAALVAAPATPPPNEANIQEVERRYLAECPPQRIIIAIPTEKKLTKDTFPKWVEKLLTPTGWQVKYFNIHGRTVAGAYNDAVKECLKDQAELLLTIEDDTACPPDALFRLMEHYRNGKVAVGGWYPKRQEVREGTPIIMKDGRRTHLDADGEVHEVFTLPMGCSLYAVKIFKDIPYPWFATTDCLTQDSFISQLLREKGHKLYVDTSIRCQHIDRKTGKIYE